MGKPDILGLGEPLVELVKLPDMIGGRPAFVQGCGGDTSTAIIAAARQGGRTGYLSAVGDDDFGRALRDLWDSEGVDASGVLVRADDPTGVCFIDPDPRARKFSYARRGSAASFYGPVDMDEGMVRAAKVLHLSGVTLAISDTMRAAAHRGMNLIRDAGGMVSLDLNYRPKLWPSSKVAADAILGAAEGADIVLPSDDEARMLLGTGDPDAIAEVFLSRGARIVAVKLGDRGAYMATPDRRWSVPPVPTKAVDSAGAGDSFAGAFLAWYLETGDAELAGNKAAGVAAGTVSGLGAVEAIPRRTSRS